MAKTFDFKKNIKVGWGLLLVSLITFPIELFLFKQFMMPIKNPLLIIFLFVANLYISGLVANWLIRK